MPRRAGAGLAKYKVASSREGYAEAAEDFTLAISLRPSNDKYLWSRGNCFRNMGEHQRAFFDYTTSIKLDNSVAKYYGARGIVLRQLNRLREAARDYTAAMELEPENGCDARGSEGRALASSPGRTHRRHAAKRNQIKGTTSTIAG